jgi:hypothetical protein
MDGMAKYSTVKLVASKFLKHANKNGISLAHIDDWLPWWECFKAGHNALTPKTRRI